MARPHAREWSGLHHVPPNPRLWARNGKVWGVLTGLRGREMTALTRTSNEQNGEVKKISAWAAIGFAPTAIASIYGMNFHHMPELHWYLGYPFAIGLMIVVSVVLYTLFKRRGWL